MLILALALAASTQAGSDETSSAPQLGEPAPADLVNRWNISVFPDGTGLPEGSGSVTAGKKIYEKHCIACHAANGAGGSGDRLAHAERKLNEPYAEKTIGNFWPYATTLFDFIRRSKPMNNPGSLTDDEVYALTAYLLFINDIIAEDAVMDKKSLSQVKMPNADGFTDVWVDDPLNRKQ